MKLYDIKIEGMREPIGLDIKAPTFSWKIASDHSGFRQKSWEIRVSTDDGKCVWNSGTFFSEQSNGICYAGKELSPCTRYQVKISVTGNNEETAEAETFFETGFLDSTIHAWEGAKWIGAPEYYVRSDTKGLFEIESEICIGKGGSCAGIVFGANDRRLLNEQENEYFLAGENYIAYVLDVSTDPVKILIYRVGYDKNDRKDVPYAEITAEKYMDPGIFPITAENKNEYHTLCIKVMGNGAYAYIDGILIDAVSCVGYGDSNVQPRQLNPRGNNDVITYPRMNEIGFWCGKHTTVKFKNLTVRNVRKPNGIFFHETVHGRLDGLKSIFDEKISSGILKCEDECWRIDGYENDIYITGNPSAHSIPMLRREFCIDKEKKVKSARLYATARGVYECYVNEKKVGNEWLTPGASQFDKHLYYQTYDITELLKEGKNAVGAVLSSGWWNDAQTFCLWNYNYWGDKESFLGKVVISYEDGSREVIVTDTESWQYLGEGPYLYAGLFAGEQYDASVEWLYKKLSSPEVIFADSKKPEEIEPVYIEEMFAMEGWRPWPEVNATEPEFIGGLQASVTEVCRINAKQMMQIAKDRWIYDFGQEMAGVPEVKFREAPGTKVILQYGEMLYPNLPEYGKLAGRLLKENYRDASSTDIYICSGNPDGEIYRPRFTFHGYRYLEISGVTSPPELCDVVSIQYSSIPEFTGEFKCSNGLLNRFAENVKWSQWCNFISILTDCPQRNERMGWAGDTHVFSKTAGMLADVEVIFKKYLLALRDLQKEGQYPTIAPVGGGFGGITYECATFVLIWELYQKYDDTQIIREHYAAMQEYICYIQRAGMPGICEVGPLGDWLAQEDTDLYLLWNAFYCYDVLLLAKMAAVIGKNRDAEKYCQMHEEAKAYWNAHFIDTESGKTCTYEGKIVDTQCSYVIPIQFGLLDERQKEIAGKNLADSVIAHGNKLTTGFFGAGALNQVLSECGYTDLAYELMLQTEYPSWLYPVTQGATSIWERWNSYTIEDGFGGNNSMNSFNHYSFGSVMTWIYEYVLGIRRVEEHPGYKYFILKPELGKLETASGAIETIYGKIESSWKVQEGKFYYSCKVPPNTSARIILPNGMTFEVDAGSYSYIVEV